MTGLNRGTFVGRTRLRTRLSVAGNSEFIMKTRNAPDQIRLQPGQEIEIGWLPEDCRALDAA